MKDLSGARAVMFAGALACLGAGLAMPTSATAQVALPSRQELDPSNVAPIAAAPRGELFKGIEAAPCAFGDSPIMVTLRSVEFRGAVSGDLALSEQTLASSYAGFLGQEAPLRVICDIRDRVASLYLRRGILASVVIPEQQITQGHLVLSVVEARIASVRYHGNGGPAQKQVERFLEQLRGMAPFNLDVAQRYLLLASDVPGINLQSALRPSPEGDGMLDLEVVISHDTFNASVAVQNHGSRTVGRELGLLRLDINGLTPLGERTSLVGYGTLSSDEQQVIQLSHRVYLGGRGWTAGVSGAWGRTRPGDVLAPLALEGASFAASARLNYPLVRHRHRNLEFGVGMDWVDQKVEFGHGLALLTEDHLRVLFARLDGHYAPAHLASHSVAVTGSLEVRQGIDGMGASRRGDPSASRFQARPDATVLRAQGEIGARLAGPLVGRLTLAWQHTNDPLLSYEEYGVGNLTIGRGYDPSVASGDRARSASLELGTVPLPLYGGRSGWRPYVFHDATEITHLGLAAGRQRLTSAGAGLRVQIGSRTALDLVWAKPLDDPFEMGSPPPSRMLVSLSAALF